jgi:hypothetical protein
MGPDESVLIYSGFDDSPWPLDKILSVLSDLTLSNFDAVSKQIASGTNPY